MSVVILKQSYVYPFTDTECIDNICALTSDSTLKLKEYLFYNYLMTEESFSKLLETKELKTQTANKAIGMNTYVTLIIEIIDEI